MSDQDLHGPNAPLVAPGVPPRPPGEVDPQADPARDVAGRWQKGVSGNPNGRPKGRYSFGPGLDRNLRGPVTPRHVKAAAIGAACAEADVPTDCACAGDLMAWVAVQRALQGQDAPFREIADRTDPKPNKVDVSLGPARRAAVPDGAPGDVERESAESFYDDLADGA